MAVKGTFSKAYSAFTYQIDWKATQDAAANQSTIECIHKLIISTAGTLAIGARTNSCTINGVSTTFKSAAISKMSTDKSATISLGTTTHTVTHDNNGDASFSIESTFKMLATIGNKYVDSIVIKDSATLDSIPRVSAFGSISGSTIGQQMTVNIVRNSDKFTHQLDYKLGNSGWISAGSGLTTSATFTIDAALQNQLPNATSGQLTLRLKTFNGNAQVGGDVTKNVTVYIQNTTPTVGTITLAPTEFNGKNILIQGKNTLTITASGFQPGSGSTIKSYKFTGPGVSQTTTSNSVETGLISQSGTLEYTVTITDSRGSTESDKATITCYEYKKPTFTKFTSYRCTADEDTSQTGIARFKNITKSDSGTYIKCDYTVTYSYVNGTNGMASSGGFGVYGGATNAVYSSWTDNGQTTGYNGIVTRSGYAIIKDCKLDSMYDIYAIFTDAYSGKVTSTTSKITGSSKIINIPKNGKAIAFGKKSTASETLDSAWPIKTDYPAHTMQNLTVRTPSKSIGDASQDTLDNWMQQGNLATVLYTSPSYVNFNKATNVYGLVLNLARTNETIENGDSRTYLKQVHQIMATQSVYQDNQHLYHRCGTVSSNESKMYDWIEVLDEKNCANYIIEQGTETLSSSTSNGITYPAVTWTYHKWNSGLFECFARYSVSNIAASSNDSWGNALYTYKIVLPKLPTKITFTEIPSITPSWQSNETSNGKNDACVALICGIKDCSNTTCGTLHLARPDTITIQGDIVLRVVGKWK